MRVLDLSLLAFAALAVEASPVRHGNFLIEKSVNGIEDDSVTATDLSNFELFAQYAGAAYCNCNDTAVNQPVTCDADVCPTVESDQATVLQVYDGDSSTNMMAFVATDPARQLVVASFRGTQSIRNWIANFEFEMVDCGLTSGCEAHGGFYTSWTQSSATMTAAVESALSANPGYALVVTGHSLGGAVATLAGATWRNAGHGCDIYTYGSPRVGNGVLADYVTAQPGGEYRVTHYDDVVPRLPPLFMGYRHTSPEYWLSEGPATKTDYGIGDIIICPGIANVSCDASFDGLDFTAHDYYLEDISACGPSGLEFRDEADAELTAQVNQWHKEDMQYFADGNA